MAVPITSDLAGYQRFWNAWLTLALILLATYATLMLTVLIAIWRRLP